MSEDVQMSYGEVIAMQEAANEALRDMVSNQAATIARLEKKCDDEYGRYIINVNGHLATIERLEGIIEGHDLVTMKLARQAATIARLEGERDRFRANAVRAYAALGWGCDFATVEDLKGGDDE